PGKPVRIAVMMALTALSLASLTGRHIALSRTTELRVRDNCESRGQANYAAQAGLQHGRELLKGRNPSDLLVGPDGTYTNTSSYLAQARTFAFRNPLGWSAARALDISSPSITGVADDGILNTGYAGGVNGTVLVPLTGMAQTVTNPYGSGTIIISRYFVKVTDNSGD